MMRALVGHFDRATVRRKSILARRRIEDACIAANNCFPALEDLADRLRAGVEGAFCEPTLRRRIWPCATPPPAASSPGAMPPLCGWRGDGQGCGRAVAAGLGAASLAHLRHLPPDRRGRGRETLAAQMRDLDLDGEATLAVARAARASHVAGEMTMPYADFHSGAEGNAYDADRLSRRRLANFEQVAHRPTTQHRPSAEGGGVPFGFLRAGPSGRLTKRFPLPGLGLPGGGHGRVLWPICQTAGSGVVRQVAEYPSGQRFLLITKSVPKRVATWREQLLAFSAIPACGTHHAERTVYAAGLNLNDPRIEVPMGLSCPLRIRENCACRQKEMRGDVP